MIPRLSSLYYTLCDVPRRLASSIERACTQSRRVEIQSHILHRRNRISLWRAFRPGRIPITPYIQNELRRCSGHVIRDRGGFLLVVEVAGCTWDPVDSVLAKGREVRARDDYVLGSTGGGAGLVGVMEALVVGGVGGEEFDVLLLRVGDVGEETCGIG